MNNGFDGNSSRCLASFSGSVSGDIAFLRKMRYHVTDTQS
jgi:hypothetical protein